MKRQLDEIYPICIPYDKLWNHYIPDEELEEQEKYRFGEFTNGYKITNPDGLWEYYDQYFYFLSEEHVLIYKLKFM